MANPAGLRVLTLLILPIVTACLDKPKEEIWRGATTLNSTHLNIIPAHPLIMDGSTTKLCFSPVATAFKIVADSIILDRSPSVHDNAALIGADGAFESFGDWSIHYANPEHHLTKELVQGRPAIASESGNLVCFFRHDAEKSHKPILRIEIWSDNPVPITRVLWWSGHQSAFL